ncbi:unnamed protein product [Trichogramma brassicae]|uniref:Uncharacterized protein n=1 Tax=Trichogramma brassicae TaxID=86971 RepID=A0A6H5IMD7_9HYME|nr:unnamed protein product [Trichogramma brassicae]
MDVKVNMDKTKNAGEKVNFEIDVKILRQHNSYIFEVETRTWYAYYNFDDQHLQNLHCACSIGDYDFAKFSLDFLQNPNGLDPVTGDSPLHAALLHGHEKIAEWLLRSGADPNSANMIGWTPLHIACRRDNDLAEKFLKICDELRKTVQIDAVDKLGYTPLRLAVSNFLPNHVKILLDRGADLSSFVFPSPAHFGERFYARKDYFSEQKLIIACNVMDVVEHLENGGYDFDESDALSIMKLFDRYELFEESSADLENSCRDDERLAKEAKRMPILPVSFVPWYESCEPATTPSLSLYDFIHLSIDEAARVLKREYYLGFQLSNQMVTQLSVWYLKSD